MKLFRVFQSRCFAMLACLYLLGIPLEAQAQPVTQPNSFTDTINLHFVNYWLRANDSLLTPWARAEMDAGTVRPSFSSTLHPVRYQLIDAANQDKIVTPMDLLCLNRAHESLALVCPSSATHPQRFVQITGSACRHHRALPAILPEGCLHPYVVTLEGRTVDIRYADSTPSPTTADPTMMTFTNDPVQETGLAPTPRVVEQTRPTVPAQVASAPVEQSQAARAAIRTLLEDNQRLRQRNKALNYGVLGLAAVLIALLCLYVFVLAKRSRKSPAPQPLAQATQKEPESTVTAAPSPEPELETIIVEEDGDRQRLLTENETLNSLLRQKVGEIAQHARHEDARALELSLMNQMVNAKVKENEDLNRELTTSNAAIHRLKEANKELEQKLTATMAKLKASGIRLPPSVPANPNPTVPPPRLDLPPGPLPGSARTTYSHAAPAPPSLGAPSASTSNTHREKHPPGTVRLPSQETTDRFAVPPPPPTDSAAGIAKEDSFEGLLSDEAPPREIGHRVTWSGHPASQNDPESVFHQSHPIAPRSNHSMLPPIEEEETRKSDALSYPSNDLMREATPRPEPNPMRPGPTREMDIRTINQMRRESLPSHHPPLDASADFVEDEGLAMLGRLAKTHHLPEKEFDHMIEPPPNERSNDPLEQSGMHNVFNLTPQPPPEPEAQKK